MMTLKDIKVSKTRIPVQNAIWLRPLGGLRFKLYYPKGRDWGEVSLVGGDSSSSSSSSGGGNSSSSSSSSGYGGRENKVIVARCIPLKAREGSRYFFADGRVKFRAKRGNRTYVYTYQYHDEPGMKKLVFGEFSIMPRLRKNNWNPIIVHIGDDSRHQVQSMTVNGTTIQYTVIDAKTLTCDTASPNFRIIEGHLRNVAPPRMPKFTASSSANARETAKSEARNFHVRALTSRGKTVRSTKSFDSFLRGYLPPITMKRQWRLWNTKFMYYLYDSPIGDSNKAKFIKTFIIQQKKKGRKSIEKKIVRRASAAKDGCSHNKVFKDLK